MTWAKYKYKLLGFCLVGLVFLSYLEFQDSDEHKFHYLAKNLTFDVSVRHRPLSKSLDSSETLSPHSAYYGMRHKDTYGLPLSWITDKSIEPKHEDWTLFFPVLMNSFRNYKITNPNKDEGSFTTAATVATTRRGYKVGETFTATLQATDSKGRLKNFGGDYFRARLVRNRTNFPDGISCRVIDNTDGTYAIEAPLPMQGKLILDIKLVLSVEGIHELTVQQTALGLWGHVYTGTFESGESMVCDMNLDTNKTFKLLPKCDYSNPRNSEPWLCLMPPSKRCTPLKYIAFQNQEGGSDINMTSHCKIYGCHVPINSSVEITVSRNENNQDAIAKMPKCSEMFSEKVFSDQISGYFEHNTWKSLQCKNWEKSPILDNKIVYFLGDSTVRQFYYLFQRLFLLKDEGPDNSHIWQQPRISTSIGHKTKNLTLYYRAHGPPLQNPGPPNTRPYMSDTIVEIPVGGKNVIVVFNIGAHLLVYAPSVFLRRIKVIKAAISKHHQRFPDTKFIVRGQNVVEYPIKRFEWNIYLFEVMFRKTFSDMKNIVYLSVWDISAMWPMRNIHPTQETLRQQAMLMLSYMS